jgi:hypothetical protein
MPVKVQVLNGGRYSPSGVFLVAGGATLGAAARGGVVSLADELRRRDVLAVMEIVEEGRRDDPGEGGLPLAVLDGLQRLVPCDNGLSLVENDLERRARITEKGVLEGEHWFEQSEDGLDPTDDRVRRRVLAVVLEQPDLQLPAADR